MILMIFKKALAKIFPKNGLIPFSQSYCCRRSRGNTSDGCPTMLIKIRLLFFIPRHNSCGLKNDSVKHRKH